MAKLCPFIARLLVAALGVFLALPSHAQPAWPTRPVKLVVPFPAGGVADVVARGVGQRLSTALSQPVVVENKPGANTILAAEQVAVAPADGYTLLFATDSTLSINPYLHARLPYEPGAFVPLSLAATTVECLLVPASLPVSSVAELVQLLKAAPGKYNYGSFGRGSSAHLAAEAWRGTTGTDIRHIPYKGVAEIIPALIGGDIQVLFASQAAALPHIKAGKIKALAVLAERRQPTLPGVPTIAEAGYPSLQQQAWFGVVAPAATPRPVIDRLAGAIAAIVASDDFQQQVLAPNGLQAVKGGRPPFDEVLARDREKYRKLVADAGLKPE